MLHKRHSVCSCAVGAQAWSSTLSWLDLHLSGTGNKCWCFEWFLQENTNSVLRSGMTARTPSKTWCVSAVVLFVFPTTSFKSSYAKLYEKMPFQSHLVFFLVDFQVISCGPTKSLYSHRSPQSPVLPAVRGCRSTSFQPLQEVQGKEQMFLMTSLRRHRFWGLEFHHTPSLSCRLFVWPYLQPCVSTATIVVPNPSPKRWSAATRMPSNLYARWSTHVPSRSTATGWRKGKLRTEQLYLRTLQKSFCSPLLLRRWMCHPGLGEGSSSPNNPRYHHLPQEHVDNGPKIHLYCYNGLFPPYLHSQKEIILLKMYNWDLNYLMCGII